MRRLNQVQSEKCRVQSEDRCAFHLGFGLAIPSGSNETIQIANETNQVTQLTAVTGCYALLLVLDEPRTLRVGKLGCYSLAAGHYVYSGSAQGPGGLGARVRRHFSRPSTRHWHIDYLRAVAEVAGVWVWPGVPRSCECVLATALAAQAGACLAVHGFGSSDCGCPGHLVALPAGTAPRLWAER
jgi:Uri superfamily endonuclease